MSIMNNEGDTVLQAAMKEAAIEKGGQIQEIIQMLKDVEVYFVSSLTDCRWRLLTIYSNLPTRLSYQKTLFERRCSLERWSSLSQNRT